MDSESIGSKADLGPPQVKYQLLISSIFNVMNFRHFSEMPYIKFQHIQKNSEIHYIEMLEIKSRHLT